MGALGKNGECVDLKKGLFLISKYVQLRPIEGRQKTLIHISLSQFVDAVQPLANRMRIAQSSRSVVGENAPGLSWVSVRQIVGPAGEFGAGLGAQDEPADIGGRTARQQIRVSEVGQ